LIALSGLDLAGQSGLLVYRRRTKETTSLLEQPLIHPATEEATQMAENDENRPLKDFAAPKAIGIQLGYTVPNIAANNFELKPALLNMLSQHMFNSLAHEDPNQHLAMFEELCNTVKINGVEPEAIKLRAFPFSLGDKARNWLRSLDTGTMRTWAQMSDVFLSKYFPPSKTSALGAQITNFRQRG
jgi:Retrotransposon gag protein